MGKDGRGEYSHYIMERRGKGSGRGRRRLHQQQTPSRDKPAHLQEFRATMFR
jgi:hypothetical protein